MKSNHTSLMIIPLHASELVCIRGGSQGWDYDIAHAIGKGTGYGIRKFLQMLRFLSDNLYEMQANTMVIYK